MKARILINGKPATKKEAAAKFDWICPGWVESKMKEAYLFQKSLPAEVLADEGGRYWVGNDYLQFEFF